MEEVQSWWEVPAIAHFCCVFRAAFNLIYFDVGELEAAILNMQDPEMSVSLEQLITRLLQGCFKEGEVTGINWEEKLSEALDEYGDDADNDENPLNGKSFHSLPPRSKVELLLKLCQIRLDIAVSEDAIKDMPAENMQAKCIGQDSDKYSYWYFSDERLYKESPLKSGGKTGKTNPPEKGKTASRSIKNGRRQSNRDKEIVSINTSSWSIVCHNLNDWEKLAKKFSRSKSSLEKELAKKIQNDYLESVEKIVAEKERLLRKRYLELAPKRTSSRISKVQAQKRLEEQRAAEAEEQRRKEYEIELAKREAKRKEQEKDARRQRAEERNKIIEERARRAQQRGMMRNFIDDYDDSNSNDNFKRTLRDTNPSSQRTDSESENEGNSDSGSQESDSDDGNSDSEVQESDNESESENVGSECDKSEKQSLSEDEDSDEKESSGDEESNDNSENEGSASTNNVNSRHFVPQGVLHYDLTKWNSSIDTKGQKLHVLKTTSSEFSDKKRFRINEAGNYTVTNLNGFNSATHKENHNCTSFQMRNCNTYSGAPRQGIVRIDFLKPATKQASS